MSSHFLGVPVRQVFLFRCLSNVKMLLYTFFSLLITQQDIKLYSEEDKKQKQKNNDHVHIYW